MVGRPKIVMAVVIAMTLMITLGAGIASAATQGVDCPGDHSKVRLWENEIGDTSDGNDTVWLCNNSSDLSQLNHTLPGNCHSGLFGSTTWNDCVTSVTVWVPGGMCLELWSSANYKGVLLGNYCISAGSSISGRREDIVSDGLSSFRWTAYPF